MGPTGHTCSIHGESVGGIHTQLYPTATNYGDYNTCGDTESDSACADAWIRLGLK